MKKTVVVINLRGILPRLDRRLAEGVMYTPGKVPYLKKRKYTVNLL